MRPILLWSNLSKVSRARHPHSVRFRIERCRTSFYCHLAEAFSQRTLKEANNVVWAFIGILKLQTSRFSQGFIWGLPYEGLDAVLLWSEISGCINIHSRHVRHTLLRKDRLHDLPYPSWSWLSTNRRISFMDPCGASIISEDTWHEPIKFGGENQASYVESVDSKSLDDEYEDELNVELLAVSSPKIDVMHYGLLRFTAWTAVLALSRAEKVDGNEADGVKADGNFRDGDVRDEDETDTLRHSWVRAVIHSPQGNQIGELKVPFLFFNKASERSGDFVLLSSNAKEKSDETCKEVNGGLDCGKIEHVNGCIHIKSRNIMLIEWEGDVAYRRGLGVVKKESWEDVKTQVTEIVLG